jgi:hypothetical protein
MPNPFLVLLMKSFVTILFSLFSIQSFSQSDAYSYQLNKIILDAKSGFINIRSTIKSISKQGDTLFNSKIQLEGTTQNEIDRSYSDTTQLIYYFSCRIDSSTVKDAKKIVEKFKNKTRKALDKSYKVEPLYQHYGPYLGTSNGYIFRGSEAIITITYGKIGNYPFAKSYLMVHKP